MELKSALVEAFIKYILPTLATAIGGVVLAALTMLTKKLQADGEKSKLSMVLGKAAHFAEVFVVEAEQVALTSLKAASADGKITDAELAGIKADVIAKIKSHMGASGLADLAEVLGGTGPGGGLVDGYLGSLVESLVHRLAGTTTTTTTSETRTLPLPDGGALVDQVKQVVTEAKEPAHP